METDVKNEPVKFNFELAQRGRQTSRFKSQQQYFSGKHQNIF